MAGQTEGQVIEVLLDYSQDHVILNRDILILTQAI